ncbi:MAG: DUF1801 domain-containing protein [Chloroflexota bacterium]
MADSEKPPVTIDEYIAAYAAEVQPLLQAMRQAIKSAAPQAEEIISYGVPCFRLNKKNLVNFGAAKSHIGFYPTPAAIEAFKEQLSVYKGAKGSVQFPFNQPLPLDLVSEMVKFRVEQVSKKK